MRREEYPAHHTIYRHFKGNLYYIMGIAEHTETGEYLVIYHALYGDGETYARPLEQFMCLRWKKVKKIQPDRNIGLNCIRINQIKHIFYWVLI
jgi:hypothetical protein